MKNGTAHAHLLGVEAFTTGKPCAPVLDVAMMNLMDGLHLQVGEGAPLLKAWIAGWHAANLLTD